MPSPDRAAASTPSWWPPRNRRDIIRAARGAYEAHMEQMLLAYPALRMTPWDDQDAAVREAWIEAVTPEERSFA